MFLVDKAGVLVLLGLLCNWNPAQGQINCIKADGVSAACGTATEVCKLANDGKPGGCVEGGATGACGDATDATFVCATDKTCCACKVADCNSEIKDHKDKRCKEAIIKDWAICKDPGGPGPVTTTETPAVTGGPGGPGESGVSVVSASIGTTFMLASLGTYLTRGLVHS